MTMIVQSIPCCCLGFFFSLEFIWFFVKIKTLPSLDIIQVCCPKPNESVFFFKVFFKINISMAASKRQYGS